MTDKNTQFEIKTSYNVCAYVSVLVGLGLMGWSPVSFGLAQGEKTEDSQGLLTKLLNKVFMFSSLLKRAFV